MARQRILLVEDDDALRYAVSRDLAACEYKVAEAHDFRDALQTLEDGDALALLIVDLVLPGVNGFALARMARLRHPNIKTIYTTGFEGVPMNEAVGPVLRKPVPSEVLLATVRDVLEQSPAANML